MNTRYYPISSVFFLFVVIIHFCYFRSDILFVEYPHSWDSFFYLVELRSYLEHGHGYYYKHQVFFKLFHIISNITNLNEVFLIKHTILLTSLAIPTLVFTHCFKLKKYLLAVLISVSMLESNLMFRQFINQICLSFALLLLLAGFYIQFHHNKKHALLTTISVICILFAASLHILAAFLAFYYFSCFSTKRGRDYYFIAILFLIFLSYIILKVFDPNTVNLIGIDNFLQFTPKRSFIPELRYREFTFITVFTISSLTALFLLAEKKLYYLYCLTPLLISILSLWFDIFGYVEYTDSLSARLPESSILFFVLFIFFIANLETKKPILFKKLGMSFISFFCLLLTCCFAGQHVLYEFDKKKMMPLLQPAFFLENKNKLKNIISEQDFVRASHSFVFMITYFLRTPSAQSFPNNSSYEHIFDITICDKKCSDINSYRIDEPLTNDCIKLHTSLCMYKHN